MTRIETTILSNLLFDDVYSRKIIPFLKKEYFSEKVEAIISEEIVRFFDKFNNPITKEILNIELANRKDINDSELLESLNLVETFTETPINKVWLVDETEVFCKQRAVYLAILESIQIIEGNDKKYTQEAIPALLSEALGVCFDTSVGHDYFEDADARFEYYRRKEEKIPFDIEILNKITGGGLSKKSLTVYLAGCVHPETKIRIRMRMVI